MGLLQELKLLPLSNWFHTNSFSPLSVLPPTDTPFTKQPHSRGSHSIRKRADSTPIGHHHYFLSHHLPLGHFLLRPDQSAHSVCPLPLALYQAFKHLNFPWRTPLLSLRSHPSHDSLKRPSPSDQPSCAPARGYAFISLLQFTVGPDGVAMELFTHG